MLTEVDSEFRKLLTENIAASSKKEGWRGLIASMNQDSRRKRQERFQRWPSVSGKALAAGSWEADYQRLASNGLRVVDV
jgi:hypothetical protein